jgi:hypothetical protein
MNWHRLAKALLIDDEGRMHAREALALRRELLADNVIDRKEVEFLLELKRAAKVLPPEFDQLFGQVIKKAVLRDGTIADSEALWLRGILFADKVITGREVQLLRELKHEARSTGREFDALYKQCTQPRA